MKIGIISDIHSNLEALQTVLEKMPSVDPIICAGDIVGYGANPNECVGLIKDRNIRCVLGNHDRAVLTGDTSWFNPLAAKAVHWTRNALHSECREFLAGLPEKLSFDFDFPLLVVHGSPMNPVEEYVLEERGARRCFEAAKQDLIIIGHTHVAQSFSLGKTVETGYYKGGGVLNLGGRTIINAGSVGQPRDGNWMASYAVIEGRRAEIFRVAYDVESASKKILGAGLPQFFADRLHAGI